MKIKADLRFLITEKETSYLADKVYAGASSFTVSNAVDFSTNDFILLGVLGSELAEIAKISSITNQLITVTTPLSFDHPQDTMIISVNYDKMNFFHSTTMTGVLTALNGSPQTIVPDDVYNSYNDTSNTTGYGWYRFYNSVTTTSSALSNAVPYAGWPDNSVKMMLDTFYTQISNRERKLIKDEDVIRWLNEAYTIARNRLNLSNRAYTVPTPTTISILNGTVEYTLPDYFSHVRTVTNASGEEIFEIPYEQVAVYNNTTVPPGGTLETKYYVRGNVIGFAPTPTASASYYLYYQRTSAVLSSYIDYIELPNANHYFLLDFLKYRSVPIVGGDAKEYLDAFNNRLNELVLTSHKQGGGLDSWGHSTTTLV
jgi:hypothetical protein